MADDWTGSDEHRTPDIKNRKEENHRMGEVGDKEFTFRSGGHLSRLKERRPYCRLFVLYEKEGQ